MPNEYEIVEGFATRQFNVFLRCSDGASVWKQRLPTYAEAHAWVCQQNGVVIAPGKVKNAAH